MLPNHQAPIHCGSFGVTSASIKGSTYREVQKEPNMKPNTGPKIMTPIVMAKIIFEKEENVKQ